MPAVVLIAVLAALKPIIDGTSDGSYCQHYRQVGLRLQDKYDQSVTNSYEMPVGGTIDSGDMPLLDIALEKADVAGFAGRKQKGVGKTDGSGIVAACILNNVVVAQTPAWKLNFSTTGGLICMQRNNAMVRDITTDANFI